MSHTTIRRWRHNYVEYLLAVCEDQYVIKEFNDDTCKWDYKFMIDSSGAWEERGHVGRFATIKGTRYFIWNTGEKTEFGHVDSNDFTPEDEMVAVFETWLDKLEES